jgi:hypothetical protein
MRIHPARLLAVGVLITALGWMGAFLWHYAQYRACAQRACPPSAKEAPIRLGSGTVLPVISSSQAEDGHLLLDYLTAQDRHRYRNLCLEAEEVWASIRDTDRVVGASVVHLGPTSSASEYLGLGAFWMPAYRCCVSTYITVNKNDAGEWQFRKACPSE